MLSKEGKETKKYLCFLSRCLGNLVAFISIPSKLKNQIHQQCSISSSFVFLFLKVWGRQWQRMGGTKKKKVRIFITILKLENYCIEGKKPHPVIVEIRCMKNVNLLDHPASTKLNSFLQMLPGFFPGQTCHRQQAETLTNPLHPSFMVSS